MSVYVVLRLIAFFCFCRVSSSQNFCYCSSNSLNVVGGRVSFRFSSPAPDF